MSHHPKVSQWDRAVQEALSFQLDPEDRPGHRDNQSRSPVKVREITTRAMYYILCIVIESEGERKQKREMEVERNV